MAQSPGMPIPTRRWFQNDVASSTTNVATILSGNLNSGGLNAYIGLYQTTKAWYGTYAVNDVRLDIDLSVGGSTSAQMFAPAVLSPGGSCIEMVTWHTLQYGIPGTTHFQGWTDWCGTNPGAILVAENLSDPTFQSKYVRTYLGQPTVALSVVTPNTGHTNGQCWYGNMYNYNAGGREQKLASCGPTKISSGATGWAPWEAYGFDPSSLCPVTPSIRATNLQFADPTSGSWTPITSFPIDVFGPNYVGSCFPTIYRFRYPGTLVGLPANSWLAKTTTPQ